MFFPVALDLTRVAVLLIGQGAALQKRVTQLEEAGAGQLIVCHAGEGGKPRLSWRERFDTDASLRWQDARCVLIAGLAREEAKIIADLARAAGKLVNAEDINDLCDFYFTVHVRRGDLLIAVSTGGASPTLARRVRDKIAALFGEEWAGRTQAIAERRLQWKAEGKSMPEVMQATDALLTEKGWL